MVTLLTSPAEAGRSVQGVHRRVEQQQHDDDGHHEMGGHNPRRELVRDDAARRASPSYP